MKCKEVLDVLKISKPTLKKYVRLGEIKVSILPNGHFDYDRNSVFQFASKNNPRKNVIYCRSYDYDNGQERLNNQLNHVQVFCNEQDIKIDEVYKDVDSSLNLNRSNFDKLIDEVIDDKIDTIYCYSQGVISTINFNFIQKLFGKFRTQIVCINPQVIDKELYKETKDLIELTKYHLIEKNFIKLQEKLKF